MQDRHDHYMQQALALAAQGIELGHGGPFGALIVVADQVVGESWNQVILRNDPTAHAEILAIRQACAKLNTFHLPEATIYTTCEPCPMCLGAIYWARIETLVFGAEAEDAAEVGFDDHRIRQALRRPIEEQDLRIVQYNRTESRDLFRRWRDSDKRVNY